MKSENIFLSKNLIKNTPTNLTIHQNSSSPPTRRQCYDPATLSSISRLLDHSFHGQGNISMHIALTDYPRYVLCISQLYDC